MRSDVLEVRMYLHTTHTLSLTDEIETISVTNLHSHLFLILKINRKPW
jgi:hypothetical protein